mgnify:CR=1 FL=1
MSLLATQSEQAASTARIEQGVAALFSDIADLFGNPRSFGAIFGLLFVSREGMSMEEVAKRLAISAGSASQGLRQLEEFGAITHARDPETRVNLYRAKTEMRPLIQGFLNQRVVPRMDSASRQLEELRLVASQLPESDAKHAQARLERLQNWLSRAKSLYPIAKKLFGKS